jgi:hypothetical protein
MVYATQSTHKLLAGISQASQVLVQDANHAGIELRWLREAIHKLDLESAFDLQPGQEQILRYIGYAEDMASLQHLTDISNSPSRHERPLDQQRQLEPPLRWEDEQPEQMYRRKLL